MIEKDLIIAKFIGVDIEYSGEVYKTSSNCPLRRCINNMSKTDIFLFDSDYNWILEVYHLARNTIKPIVKNNKVSYKATNSVFNAGKDILELNIKSAYENLYIGITEWNKHNGN